MSDELNRGDVMRRRFELVEQIAVIAGQQEAVLAPLKSELALCEKYIQKTMVDGNEQQFKLDSGETCYFTTKDSIRVQDMDGVIDAILAQAPYPQDVLGDMPERQDADKAAIWSEVLQHIKARAFWGLLKKDVSKTAAKELLAAGKPVAGLKYEQWKGLSWSRG